MQKPGRIHATQVNNLMEEAGVQEIQHQIPESGDTQPRVPWHPTCGYPPLHRCARVYAYTFGFRSVTDKTSFLLPGGTDRFYWKITI